MLQTILDWFLSQYHSVQEQVWIAQVFFIVLGTLLVAYIEGIVYRRVYPKFEKSGTLWDDSVVYAMHRPLLALIWLMGLTAAADLVAMSGDHTAIFSIIAPARSLGIIVIFAWFMIRVVDKVEQNFIKGRTSNAVDKTTVYALGKLFKAAILITATLVALQTFGIGISGILAFGGIGGAAVAFSAKDLLANFFGGLIVYLDRPFAVGDWIRSPDRKIEGTVEYIGWRCCRIRTFDKRPLYVPNNVFTNISIENPSRMRNRRIKTFIGVRYDDAAKLKVILQDIEDMLRNHPEIDTTQTLMVNLVEFGASSLNFMVYTFTKTTNWVEFQGIQQDVFLKIIDIIMEHGAECAFPTTTVHIPEVGKIKQMAKLSMLSEKVD